MSKELEKALELLREVSASLAWNCFGECRAVHDGPIMPANIALEEARVFLASQHGKQFIATGHYANPKKEWLVWSAVVAGGPKHPEQADGVQGEREAFKSHFKHLDFSEDLDAWGRPRFIHPDVEALWSGWQARAAMAQPSPAPELDQLYSMLGVTDQVQAGERIGFLVGQSIMVPKLEAQLKRGTVYVEARQCDECQHGGINDSADGLAACHDCDWTGPDPLEDKCPGCQSENCMAAACPQCGARYVLVASEEMAAPVAQAGQVPDEVRHWSDCATNNRGCPDLLGPCDCGGYKEGDA